MAFDFPTNPPVGTMFGPPGGPMYQYDGLTWNAMPGVMVGYTSYSDAPPANPVPGQFWFNSTNGVLYLWYDDGNSKQWVAVSGGMPASVKTARPKNFVINPVGQMSQESGYTGITAANGYFADQWYGGDNVATSTRTWKATGSAIRFQPNVTVASLAAGEYSYWFQPIEGYRIAELGWGGSLSPVPIVVRFDANVAKAGVYGLSIRNGGSTRSYVHEFTLPAGVSKGLSCSVPADVTGTWPVDNTISMSIGFCVCCGTTVRASAADTWLAGNFIAGPNCQTSLTSGIYEITNVGLYADPDNTGIPPPWQPPKYEDDLDACQRYWYTMGFQMGGYNGAGSTDYYFLPCKASMRVTPTISYTTTTSTNCSAAQVMNATPDGALIFAQIAATGAYVYNGSYRLSARM